MRHVWEEDVLSDKEQYLKHLHMWLEVMFSALEQQTDEETRTSMLESCGRACARHGGVVTKAKAIKDNGKKIDELLDNLSRETSGLVEWRREGNVVQLVYKKCFCPLRKEELVKSPTFCSCSCGWIREVFETASGKPVKVECQQTIGRGDPICKFIIRP
jgi:predicted hydrocarbon binding protein